MRKIIVANWKCNPKTLKEARTLFSLIQKDILKNKEIIGDKEIIICPPFVYLPFLSMLIKKRELNFIKLGAQNFFWKEEGPFTGEISPLMLKDLNIEYVIVGHSERRKILGEKEEMINKKLKAAIKNDLKPIFCIGETFFQYKKKKTFEVLKKQLKKGLEGIEIKKRKIIVAYEPVWAIGSGNPCLAKEAKKVLSFLKENLKDIYLLYGGSVNSKIARNYFEVGFDGLLIGSASLNPQEFIEILKNSF